MKKSILLFFSIILIFAFYGCDESKNPTAPSKEELGASPSPQPVPSVIADAITENGNILINTEHVYSTDPSDGSVDWLVDTSVAGHIPGIGEHSGELQWLDIKIIFTKPYFYTSEGLAGYYIGLPVNFEIQITNTGNRNYEHLDIVAIHEYYESKDCNRWWYPYPQEVSVSKGEPLPGNSMQYWRDIQIGKGEKIVLQGTYTPPLATCDGLDQIHLIIQHTNNGALHAATMYYNPEAAVYCPPPPSE